MEENTKRIVEINGVKIEVDLRYAKTIESYKVGDKIKVLKKKYSDTYASYPGIIAGFDNFKELPTLVIAHIDIGGYNSQAIEFDYLNKNSTDIEICPMVDDYISLTKETVLDFIDKAITKSENEILELKHKKDFFLLNFSKYFSEIKN